MIIHKTNLKHCVFVKKYTVPYPFGKFCQKFSARGTVLKCHQSLQSFLQHLLFLFSLLLGFLMVSCVLGLMLEYLISGLCKLEQLE